jgi:hypothetical protein
MPVNYAAADSGFSAGFDGISSYEHCHFGSFFTLE